MKDRRGFLKTLGLGAVAAGPLAAAAVAGSKEEQIDKALKDAVKAPATPEQIEALTKALEQGMVSQEQASQALGFGLEEAEKAAQEHWDHYEEAKRRIKEVEDSQKFTQEQKDRLECQFGAMHQGHIIYPTVAEHYPQGWSKSISIQNWHHWHSPTLGQLLSLGGISYTLIERDGEGDKYEFFLDRPLETPVPMGHRVVMRTAAGRFYDKGMERPKFIQPPTRHSEFDMWPFAIEATRPNGLVEHLTGSLKLRDEGTQYLYNLMFSNDTPILDWRIGLIDNYGFCAMSNCDKYHSHMGWQEFTGYDTRIRPWGNWHQKIRPQWHPMSVHTSEIRIQQTGTIKGFFVCGSYGVYNTQTIGDQSPDGTLWGMCLFDQGDRKVIRGDTLKIGQVRT